MVGRPRGIERLHEVEYRISKGGIESVVEKCGRGKEDNCSEGELSGELEQKEEEEGKGRGEKGGGGRGVTYFLVLRNIFHIHFRCVVEILQKNFRYNVTMESDVVKILRNTFYIYFGHISDILRRYFIYILAKGRDISEILQNILQQVMERNKIIMRKNADRLQRSY